MKHRLSIALLAAGAGLLTTIGIWATTATHAATSPLSGVDQQVPAVSMTATTTAPTPMGNHHQQKLAAMAELLGITSDQLQTELQSGKEFYQIAAEHGVTYDKLKANQDSVYKARLDDMVKVGYLTQAEADAAYAQYQAQVQQAPVGGMMGFGHGFHHGLGF